MGIVTFQDDNSENDDPTFHMVSKLHLELFGLRYYPVWSAGAHQDPWIFFLYDQLECATKLSHEVFNHVTGEQSRYDYGSADNVWLDAERALVMLIGHFPNKDHLLGKLRKLAWFQEKYPHL